MEYRQLGRSGLRDRQPTSGARHLTDWNEPPVYDEARTYDIIDVVVHVAEAHNVPPSQVALAWLLTKPALVSLIVGAREEAQCVTAWARRTGWYWAEPSPALLLDEPPGRAA
jgi:aryl-alcohol dehydrogenase-like predicted oxidoreductase